MPEQEKIHALIYLSRDTQGISVDEINLIKLKANEKNTEHQITGFLSYANNRFFQYIEGPKEKLEQLMVNIKNDSRHEVIRQLEFNEFTKRRFPEWKMRVFTEEDDFIESIESKIYRILSHFNSENYQDEMTITMIQYELESII